MKNLNLSQRISIYLFFVVGLSTFLMNSVFFIVLKNQSQDLFNSQAEEIIDNMSRYYQLPIWNMDHKTIDEVTEAAIQSRSGVLNVKLTDEVGNLILEKTKTDKSYSQLMTQSHILNKRKKIFRENSQHIGFVEVLFSNQEHIEDTYYTFIKSILGSLLFAFFLSIISHRFLTFLLHKPLYALIIATQSARNSSYTIRVPDDGPGEIGLLASEFNKTMNQIEIRDKKLSHHNNELEETIRARTFELDKQRATMINSSRLAALGEFSAGMSHEINNPLAVIIGKATLLRTYVGKGLISKDYDGHFTKITEMCDRISKIIKNLRSFARDGTNDPFDYFELPRFLTDIGELTRLKLDKKAIAFRMQNNCSSISIYGKEIPLSQVIINLINNSADAVENSEDPWVELTIAEDEESVSFTVTDSGHGIDEDVQKKMLVPFYTTKVIGKGTGLGLSISKNIIEDHKGQLIYDRSSKNTCFIVKLPKI